MFGNVGGVIMMENFVLCSVVFQRQPSVKNKSLDLVCREEKIVCFQIPNQPERRPHCL